MFIASKSMHQISKLQYITAQLINLIALIEYLTVLLEYIDLFSKCCIRLLFSHNYYMPNCHHIPTQSTYTLFKYVAVMITQMFWYSTIYC